MSPRKKNSKRKPPRGGNGQASKNGQPPVNGSGATPDAAAQAEAPVFGLKASELGGTLIVVEGTDGSGRSTHITLLTEWLESEGFAVQSMGLRRSAVSSWK